MRTKHPGYESLIVRFQREDPLAAAREAADAARVARRGEAELRRLLVANGFQVWIVTGSVQAFVRAFLEDAFAIPPERVIGTWTTPVYGEEGGTVTMVRGGEQVYNGYENKPAHIHDRIGRRPVFAAGNSNNDQAMSRLAVTGARRRASASG